MKITKKEWVQIWAELTDDWYIEEGSFPEVEEDQLPDVFEGDAWLCYQAKDREKPMPAFLKESDRMEGVQFKTVYARWKKLQTTTCFAVEVLKENQIKLKDLITTSGLGARIV
jgi:hypothetical protein